MIHDYYSTILLYNKKRKRVLLVHESKEAGGDTYFGGVFCEARYKIC